MTPELILRAYAYGVFPMAKSGTDSNVFWVQPKLRGILPLDGFHVSRSLRKVLRQGRFQVTADEAFSQVMAGCAAPTPTRPETWINQPIVEIFTRLHEAGLAHSIEVWREGALVGGVYGLAMGAAFFGESMFSHATNASKVALCHLVALLRRDSFTLLDTQFMTEHLRRFGAVEVSQDDYLKLLAAALQRSAQFGGALTQRELEALLFSQRSTQTS
jgi:leucyl/phenylalanyl-tRNA--protein transferase